MKDIDKSIFINASPEKVWDSMLNTEAYTQWADVFSPDGSAIVKTDWQLNSVIDFIDNEDSGLRGHISQSEYGKVFEIIVDGELKGGTELDTESQGAKDMIGMNELYRFTEKDNGTQLDVHTSMNEEWYDTMSDAWQKALEKIKKLAE